MLTKAEVDAMIAAELAEVDDGDNDNESIVRQNTAANSQIDLAFVETSAARAHKGHRHRQQRLRAEPPLSPKNSNNTDLVFFEQKCPGVQGPGTVTDMFNAPLRVLLDAWSVLEIPIFQRRFAWDSVLLDQFWKDVSDPVLVSRSARGKGHRLGKILVRRKALDHDDVDPWTVIVIDGQQRLTTSMILCACLRDALMEVEDHEGATLAHIRELQRVLFLNPSEELESDPSHREFIDSLANLQRGNCHSQSRLVPSFPDRLTFSCAVLAPMRSWPTTIPKNQDDGMKIMQAREHFSRVLAPLGFEALCAVKSRLLNELIFTVQDVRTPQLDFPRVFQWHQKRAIAAAGVPLFKAAPNTGAQFRAMDLIRNLFLSHFINQRSDSGKTIEAVYTEEWLPLEDAFAGDAFAFDDSLRRYISKAAIDDNAAETDMQKHVRELEELFANSKSPSVDLRGMRLYADFCKLYVGRMKSGQSVSSFMSEFKSFLTS